MLMGHNYWDNVQRPQPAQSILKSHLWAFIFISTEKNKKLAVRLLTGWIESNGKTENKSVTGRFTPLPPCQWCEEQVNTWNCFWLLKCSDTPSISSSSSMWLFIYIHTWWHGSIICLKITPKTRQKYRKERVPTLSVVTSTGFFVTFFF